MTDRYFSNSYGDNTNGDGSKLRPWKDHTKFNASVVAGDVCYFLAGDTWTGAFVVPAINVTMTRYGTGPDPIFDGAGGASVRIAATAQTNLVLDHLEIKGSGTGNPGVKLITSHSNLIIRNCYIHDNAGVGVLFDTGCTGVANLIENCKIANNSKGVHFQGTMTGCAVRRCQIVDHAAAEGVHFSATAEGVVVDSLFENNLIGVSTVSTKANGHLQVRRNRIHALKVGVYIYPGVSTTTFLASVTDNVIAVEPDTAGATGFAGIYLGNGPTLYAVCNTFRLLRMELTTARVSCLMTTDNVVRVVCLGNDFVGVKDAETAAAMEIFDSTLNFRAFNGNSYPDNKLVGDQLIYDTTQTTGLSIGDMRDLGWELSSSFVARTYQYAAAHRVAGVLVDGVAEGDAGATATPLIPAASVGLRLAVAPNLSHFTETDVMGNQRKLKDLFWVPGAVSV